MLKQPGTPLNYAAAPARTRWMRMLLAFAMLAVPAGCGDDPTSVPSFEDVHLIVVDGNAQFGFPNDTLDDSIRVQALDAGGRPRAGVRVEWVVTEGDGSLSLQSSLTDAAGRTSAAWRLGSDTLHEARARIVGSTRNVTFEARARGFTFRCVPASFENRPGDLRAISCGATSVGGFAGTIGLSSVAVSGFNVSFSPDALTLNGSSSGESSIVLLDIGSTAVVGDYVLDVRATSAGQIVIAPLTVRIR